MADINELDLSNFIDVVTTYKCKFCSFLSSKPELIASHIKASHFQPDPKKFTSITDKENSTVKNLVSLTEPQQSAPEKQASLAECPKTVPEKQCLVTERIESFVENPCSAVENHGLLIEQQGDLVKRQNSTVNQKTSLAESQRLFLEIQNPVVEGQEAVDDYQTSAGGIQGTGTKKFVNIKTKSCQNEMKSGLMRKHLTNIHTGEVNRIKVGDVKPEIGDTEFNTSQSTSENVSLSSCKASTIIKTAWEAAEKPTSNSAVIICVDVPPLPNSSQDDVIQSSQQVLKTKSSFLETSGVVQTGERKLSTDDTCKSDSHSSDVPETVNTSIIADTAVSECKVSDSLQKKEIKSAAEVCHGIVSDHAGLVISSEKKPGIEPARQLQQQLQQQQQQPQLYASANVRNVSNVAPASGTSSKTSGLDCLLSNGSPQTGITSAVNAQKQLESQTVAGGSSAQRKGDNVVIKEFFLCGLCSQTFCTMEAVGDHMRGSHPEAVAVLNAAGTKKADGNQGEDEMAKKRKPGRRKKSEIVETEREKKDEDSEDEDWQPGQELGIRHDGRKRRKTRPPRALKKDYYIERETKTSPSNKKRRVRYSIVDSHSLKCHIFGCQARFAVEQTLEYHLHCHDDSGCFVCPECKQEFKIWCLLKLHLWKEHHIDLDLFRCNQCDYRVDTIRKLNIHKEIHSENRPYTCDICGKGFKQFSQMKNHQVIHEVRDSKDLNTWYASKQCDICKRWYANKKSLQKHIEAVHEKIRPYLCPFCNHKAARKAMIQLHIRTHTGEKPFMCNVCHYSTGDHNSMRKHRMRHTGQRQYKCKYCSYSCIQAISLKSHLKTKHPGKEGIYSCSMCHFKTVNKVYYDNHARDHRNGLAQTVATEAKPKRHRRAPQTLVADSVLKPEPVQVEMQVQTLESGEAQISADDLSRLSSCSGLLSGEITAVQLIYSALSAISQNPQSNSGTSQTTQQLAGGVETTIRSELGTPGVTNHVITFRVPSKAPSSTETQSEQVVYTEAVEVVETGQARDQTALQIDLESLPVTGAEATRNIEQISAR